MQLKQTKNNKMPLLITLIVFLLIFIVVFFIRKSAISPDQTWSGPEHALPIVSITTENSNLFDPDTGIYVKGNHDNINQTGPDWVKPALLSYYDHSSKLQFNKPIKLQLHGWNMRSLPQKAFRLTGDLDYPFFGSTGNQQYSSLVLRVSDSQKTMIRDQLASQISQSASDLDVQIGQPVVVYLNQEYWGLYWLQERFDDQYFHHKYRLPAPMLGMVEIPLRSGDDRGLSIPVDSKDQPEADRFNSLLNQTRRCRGCQSYDSIGKYIDADNLIDFLLLEFFFDNPDWPFNNTKAYRFKVEPAHQLNLDQLQVFDGRFRWLLFDLDTAFGSAQTNTYGKLLDEAFPFRNLFYDQTFRTKYYSRVSKLVESELNPDQTLSIFNQIVAQLEPEMTNQINRWPDQIQTIEDWHQNLDHIKIFLKDRPTEFFQHTSDYLNTTQEFN